MKYCTHCGKKIDLNFSFCDGCGMPCKNMNMAEETPEPTANENQETANQIEVQVDPIECAPLKNSKLGGLNEIKKNKKVVIIIGAIVLIVIAAVLIVWNVVSLNAYKDDLASVYSLMISSSTSADEYCMLQEDVWRNSIFKTESAETDKYTKRLNGYGDFYSDFNDALQSLHDDPIKKVDLIEISGAAGNVSNYMSKLEDCPSKFENEYNAIKTMYVAYSDLIDLAIGDSSYTLAAYIAALDTAEAAFKSAESSASVLIE